MSKPSFGQQRSELKRMSYKPPEKRGRLDKLWPRTKILRPQYVLIEYSSINVASSRHPYPYQKSYGSQKLRGEMLSTIVEEWLRKGGPLNDCYQICTVDPDTNNIVRVPVETLSPILEALSKSTRS